MTACQVRTRVLPTRPTLDIICRLRWVRTCSPLCPPWVRRRWLRYADASGRTTVAQCSEQRLFVFAHRRPVRSRVGFSLRWPRPRDILGVPHARRLLKLSYLGAAVFTCASGAFSLTSSLLVCAPEGHAAVCFATIERTGCHLEIACLFSISLIVCLLRPWTQDPRKSASSVIDLCVAYARYRCTLGGVLSR